MLDVKNLPDNINVTVTKNDLLELFNICLQKNTTKQKQTYPEYLTIKQLAEYINYSAPAVYKMISQAVIPCYKIAGKILFRKIEIDEWLFKFRQPTNEEKVDDLNEGRNAQ